MASEPPNRNHSTSLRACASNRLSSFCAPSPLVGLNHVKPMHDTTSGLSAPSNPKWGNRWPNPWSTFTAIFSISKLPSSLRSQRGSANYPRSFSNTLSYTSRVNLPTTSHECWACA